MCLQAQSVFRLRKLEYSVKMLSITVRWENSMNSESPASGQTEWVSSEKPQTSGRILDGAHPVFRTDLSLLHLGLFTCAQGLWGLVRGPQLLTPMAACCSSAGGWCTGTGEAETVTVQGGRQEGGSRTRQNTNQAVSTQAWRPAFLRDSFGNW